MAQFFDKQIVQTIMWLIVFILLLVIENISLGLTTIWFAIGALVACVASLFDAGVYVELILFVIVSFATLVLTRPFAMKYLSRNSEKTNVEEYIGMNAVVNADIVNREERGTVIFHGERWSARAKKGDEVIHKGSLVTIVAVEGNKLIVEEQ